MTEQAAIAKAERLARRNPEETYYVVATVDNAGELTYQTTNREGLCTFYAPEAAWDQIIYATGG